jgi:hypothetical protein
MRGLIALSRALFGWMSLCAASGAIIGSTAGVVLAGVISEFPHVPMTARTVAVAWALLTLLGWVVALVIVGGWLRYGARRVALAALLNAAITTLLVTFANLAIRRSELAVPIGFVIGAIVGTVLCFLCNRVPRMAPRG